MDERQAKAEIADIRTQLNSLISMMYNIADCVDRDFYGVGNELCAKAIRDVANKYGKVVSTLNSIDVSDAVAKINRN